MDFVNWMIFHDVFLYIPILNIYITIPISSGDVNFRMSE